MELTTKGSGENQSIYLHHHSSNFQRKFSHTDSIRELHDDDLELKWAAIQKLPTFERLRTALFDASLDNGDESESQEKRLIDVTKIGDLERHLFIEKLINHIQKDNLRFLRKLRERIDRVGVKLPTVEVRYKNLCVEAECEVVKGNASSTLWNSLSSLLFAIKKSILCTSRKAKISILKDVSGVIKPSRLTLLLGPPGSGKTALLLALSGHTNHFLKVAGEVTYNGYRLDEFVPQKTSAYISQHDLHIPEMTVKETIDFSARCQGVGSREEIMKEVCKREKDAGIVPDTEIDTFMKATAVKGQRSTLQTDYILKVLGLDMCANIIVGDTMQRGISGGQKKRLTTGEMIVGPTKALFMDEISTGLDTSTTFQIISYIQQLLQTTDATALVALLQPAPETFELFDDIILLAEGRIVYHGPRNNVLEYFEIIGFKCPERKGVADFLQEVISEKDQEQYWYRNDITYSYISVDQFCEIFKASSIWKDLNDELSRPYDKTQSHKDALSFNKNSLRKRELFKACMSKEFLLMKRSSFVYIFKTSQLIIIASITMTIFIRTRMTVDLQHSEYFMGVLFYTVIRLLTNGAAEVTFTCLRLPVFYKQRSIHLYPAWAYCIPASIIKIPISFIESLLWTSITYYVIGYTPEIERFFRQFILLFALHLSSTSLCRFIASVFQNVVTANTCGSLSLVAMFLFGGFLLPRESLPACLRWGFWMSLMSYAEIGITVNEFLAPRWQKVLIGNTTLGHTVLKSHGLNFAEHYYWISVGALIGFMIIFDIGFILALTYLKPSGMSKAAIFKEKLSQRRGYEDSEHSAPNFHTKRNTEIKVGNVVLPFQPITMTFMDVQYFVDMPPEMREQGSDPNKLQLLQDMTGVFRPGKLTALMGVSGAGKTTLMDVLSGRKNGGGIIEGEIKIGGYPKVQETFARISGYCEQNDIHSPYITVEESVTFSAWLRLPSQIDPEIRARFVQGVIEIIELDDIRDSVVGIPGQSGLSTEQRKRLTIAVELVSNPAIMFMDEPTSGLDARSAAIVMRVVKNIVVTGRTIICTIHQPSIDIFEEFDELILMKRGGQIIYSGMLGHHSSKLLEYFESIPGLPKIKDNYNPATWMLEVTSASVEAELGLDFADIYQKSALYQDTIKLVREFREPIPESQDLELSSKFARNSWEQYVACLWKQHLSYWRNSQYNSTRFTFMIAVAVLTGAVFWQKGQIINNEQDLFNMLGLMFISVMFLGINNCTSIIPCVAQERNVLYRERFAAMYSSWAYSLAQVTIEIPYILLQAILFVAITYPSIGYHWSAYKFLWYIYATFCTFLYSVYLGMLIVSLSRNVLVATVLSAAVSTILSLFSGFLMPGPKIPGWWIWLYRICPTSWSLYGLLSSQYGDLEKKIEIFGELKSVSSFLEDFFGFRHGYLGLVAFILITFPIFFGILFAYCIARLNFQRR